MLRYCCSFLRAYFARSRFFIPSRPAATRLTLACLRAHSAQRGLRVVPLGFPQSLQSLPDILTSGLRYHGITGPHFQQQFAQQTREVFPAFAFGHNYRVY